MIEGGLTIRAGDVDADRKLAIEMFVRHLNPHYNEARFDWMYRQNPHGQGRLWVATDREGRTLVGIAGAFPRRMCVSGRAESAWVLGDFCVSEAYRAIGPALALQRACLAQVTEGAVPFCYDFPSFGMMAVYRRLGIKPLGRMVRLVKPLSVAARLHELFGSKIVSRHLNTLARMFLAPRDRGRPSVPGLEISLAAEPFGQEFTELFRAHAEQQVVMLERSAEYLNWRYLTNPVHQHAVLTARHSGRLAGYAIFRQDHGVMTLVDVFAAAEVAIVAELVHSAVVLAWQRGLESISISLLESSSAWIKCFKRAGFREREAHPVVVYTSRTASPEVGDDRSWLLLEGDRDS